jgi:hypothetical protein
MGILDQILSGGIDPSQYGQVSLTPPTAPAQPVPDAVIAAIQQAQAQPKRSFFDKLGQFGAGVQDATDGGNREAQYVAQQQAQGGAKGGPANVSQFYKIGQAGGLTGQELLSFALNPQEWAKNRATRVGYHDAPAGSDAIFGDPGQGGAIHHVNQTGISGDTPYAVDGQGQATYGAPRNPTFQELTGRLSEQTAAARAQADIAKTQAETAMAGIKDVPADHSVINFLQGGGQSQYDPIISQAEQQYGLPPGLLGRVIHLGENSAPNATSPKGAQGIAQLMPGTASDMGVTDPMDPAQAIPGAARYLRQNLDRFGGDPVKAVAAYNAGPGAVQKHGGVPPYAETQDYVSRVLGTPKVLYTAPAKDTGEDAPQLSDGAIQQFAENVVGGGQLPSLGMGKNATAAKVAIANRVAQIQQAGGIDGYNALTNRASNKANSAALVKLTSQRQLMASAEQAASDTFDQALAHAQATHSAGSGVPLISGLMQQGSMLLHTPNAPDVVKFKNLLEDGSNEYAKVIAGSTSGHGATDSARREAMARLNMGMTLPELMKGREAVRQAMAAKISAQDRQIAAVKASLGQAPGAVPQQRQAANQQLIQRSASAPPPIPKGPSGFKILSVQ